MAEFLLVHIIIANSKDLANNWCKLIHSPVILTGKRVSDSSEKRVSDSSEKREQERETYVTLTNGRE